MKRGLLISLVLCLVVVLAMSVVAPPPPPPPAPAPIASADTQVSSSSSSSSSSLPSSTAQQLTSGSGGSVGGGGGSASGGGLSAGINTGINDGLPSSASPPAVSPVLPAPVTVPPVASVSSQELNELKATVAGLRAELGIAKADLVQLRARVDNPPVVEKPAVQGLFTTMFVVIDVILFAVMVVLGVMVWKMRKAQPNVLPQESSQKNIGIPPTLNRSAVGLSPSLQKLADYVSSKRAEGEDARALRNRLIAAGWQQDDVERVLGAV